MDLKSDSGCFGPRLCWACPLGALRTPVLDMHSDKPSGNWDLPGSSDTVYKGLQEKTSFTGGPKSPINSAADALSEVKTPAREAMSATRNLTSLGSFCKIAQNEAGSGTDLLTRLQRPLPRVLCKVPYQ